MLTFDLLQEMDSLMCLQVLDQFRTKVVSIVVSHQLCQLVVDLLDDVVYKISVGRFLKVVLQELGTYLFSC